MNLFIWIIRFQVKQLGDHQIGDLIINRAEQKHDSLFKHAEIDVIDAFASGRHLNNR